MEMWGEAVGELGDTLQMKTEAREVLMNWQRNIGERLKVLGMDMFTYEA